MGSYRRIIESSINDARPQRVAAAPHAGQQASFAKVLHVAIDGGPVQAHVFGDGLRIYLKLLGAEEVQHTQCIAQITHGAPVTAWSRRAYAAREH